MELHSIRVSDLVMLRKTLTIAFVYSPDDGNDDVICNWL